MNASDHDRVRLLSDACKQYLSSLFDEISYSKQIIQMATTVISHNYVHVQRTFYKIDILNSSIINEINEGVVAMIISGKFCSIILFSTEHTIL